jgi:hypothetical protein
LRWYRLILTFGPDGKRYTKQDDLQLHHSGQQVLTKVVEEDLTVLVEGRTGPSGCLVHWRTRLLARHLLHGCVTPAPGFMTMTTLACRAAYASSA